MRAGHLEDRRRGLVQDALAARAGPTTAVLEIGAGTGKLLASLAAQQPRVQFDGIDVAPGMVEYARAQYRLPNLRYLLADVGRDPLPTTYQFVYSIDVIHHIHQLSNALAAIRGAMDTGATWLAIEPNVFHPYIFFHQERLRRAGFDEDHFRPWRVGPLFRQAGFEIAARRYAFLLPGWVKRPPRLLRASEHLCEGFPLLGGSVVYVLMART